MDKEEYKRRLSEVAEWHIPTHKELVKAKPQRRKKDEQILDLVESDYGECEDCEEREEQQPAGPNPTFPPVVTKLKIKGCWCEDCGKFCEEGRKTEKKIYKAGKPHWRDRCVTCQMFKHPITGKYTLNNVQASHFFNALTRETLGVNDSKFNDIRKKAGFLTKE